MSEIHDGFSAGPRTASNGAGPARTARPRNVTDPSGIAAEPLATDICVIGAGAGGLSVAIAAAAFGRRVVLVEKNRMGGAALNAVVPSGALLAASRRANAMRTAGAFGIGAIDPQIDHRAVYQHTKSVVAALLPNSSVERLTGLGVRVILGAARFLDKKTVLAGDYRISAHRFVLATGAPPLLPPIEGLGQCPYFTTETIFDNDRKLSNLIVVGAGSAGLELAQAHARLGSRVLVIDQARALGSDDPEASAVVLKALAAEGIEVREGVQAVRAEAMPGAVRLHVTTAGVADHIDGSHLLIAAGHRPDLSDLNLTVAGIKRTVDGITVNRGLRTSNSRVYAIGGVTGGEAGVQRSVYHGGVVLRRALFRLPAKADPALVTRVTFTDPELAQVGLTEQEAREAGQKINVLRWPFAEVDRAEIERDTTGHVKVVTSPAGHILGATIVGAGAGELIQVWALAVAERLHITAVAGFVVPYPTLGEVSKRAALRHVATTASRGTVRKLIDFLARLG